MGLAPTNYTDHSDSAAAGGVYELHFIGTTIIKISTYLVQH